MRIIDKQHDYYDYLQDPTDTIVFDRRGSFLLTREMFLNKVADTKYWRKAGDTYYVVMQCGATFWLFEVVVKESLDDYELKLLHHWKNYNKPRLVLNIVAIDFTYESKYWNISTEKYYNLVDNNQYRIKRIVSLYTTYKDHKGRWTGTDHEMPLLVACGVSELVPAQDIFTAIEEHFSMLKTESERTDPLGATNDDKITMHGFDTKTSFRGK